MSRLSRARKALREILLQKIDPEKVRG